MYNLVMSVNFKSNNIAELRKDKKLSQRELAKMVDTSQANISRWEKGLNEPSIIECWKLADFFEVSLDVVCGRKEY